MLNLKMIGVLILATLSSCKPPTIKEPVSMYILSLKYTEAGNAYKNLDITSDPSSVGSWVTEVQFLPLHELPQDLMCFTLKDWLTKVRPTLKEGAQYYKDHK